MMAPVVSTAKNHLTAKKPSRMLYFHQLVLVLSCLLLLEQHCCDGFFIPATTSTHHGPSLSLWRKATSSPTTHPKHNCCYQSSSSSFPTTTTTRAHQSSSTSDQEVDNTVIVNGESSGHYHSTEEEIMVETTNNNNNNKGVLEQHHQEQELFHGEKWLLEDNNNGRACFEERLDDNNFSHIMIHKKDLMPNAPALTFHKYLTMQQKRVVVTFRFTDLPYLRPYYLTFASKLKRRHSDLLIEKRVLPMVEGGMSSSPIFEVLVDGKIVIGDSQSRERHVPGGRVDVQNTQSVFVSMEQLGHAISKARKKRRPSTVYGAEEDGNDNPGINPSRRLRRTFVR